MLARWYSFELAQTPAILAISLIVTFFLGFDNVFVVMFQLYFNLIVLSSIFFEVSEKVCLIEGKIKGGRKIL